jgi:hypothetical protein
VIFLLGPHPDRILAVEFRSSAPAATAPGWFGAPGRRPRLRRHRASRCRSAASRASQSAREFRAVLRTRFAVARDERFAGIRDSAVRRVHHRANQPPVFYLARMGRLRTATFTIGVGVLLILAGGTVLARDRTQSRSADSMAFFGLRGQRHRAAAPRRVIAVGAPVSVASARESMHIGA